MAIFNSFLYVYQRVIHKPTFARWKSPSLPALALKPLQPGLAGRVHYGIWGLKHPVVMENHDLVSSHPLMKSIGEDIYSIRRLR